MLLVVPKKLYQYGKKCLRSKKLNFHKIKAGDYLNQALEVDPNFADVYVRLAQLAKIKKDYGKYDQYLAQALKLDPGNELALDTLSGNCKYICTGGEEK